MRVCVGGRCLSSGLWNYLLGPPFDFFLLTRGRGNGMIRANPICPSSVVAQVETKSGAEIRFFGTAVAPLYPLPPKSRFARPTPALVFAGAATDKDRSPHRPHTRRHPSAHSKC